MTDYFNVDNWRMNDTIYISQVSELLRKEAGVINVVNLTFVNKVSGDYSNNTLPSTTYASLSDVELLAQIGETDIMPNANTIKLSPGSMLEIKYPANDILGNAI